MNDPWFFVDAVYCITLDTATHRHARVQTELERVGLWAKTTMLVNKRDPRGGVRGCYDSHQRAWNAAKEKGASNVLILEDDVFFSKDWEKYLPYAAAFVTEAATPWDLFFLGWAPFRSRTTKWKHVAKMMCGTDMHAYIVSRAALERGLPPFESHRTAVDVLLMCPACSKKERNKPMSKCFKSSTPYNIFVLQPSIAFQRYDKTSATGNNDAANRRREKVRLMRFFGQASTVADTPTMVFVLGIIALILLLGVVATVITVPIVLSKKKKAGLQGGGVNTSVIVPLVATLVPLMVLLGLLCGSAAYQGKTLFIHASQAQT
jgi:GR25 family glycosyltransferase involved in LPS biosynthesis